MKDKVHSCHRTMNVKFQIFTYDSYHWAGNLANVEFDKCENAVKYILENWSEDLGEEWLIDVIRTSGEKAND